MLFISVCVCIWHDIKFKLSSYIPGPRLGLARKKLLTSSWLFSTLKISLTLLRSIFIHCHSPQVFLNFFRDKVCKSCWEKEGWNANHTCLQVTPTRRAVSTSISIFRYQRKRSRRRRRLRNMSKILLLLRPSWWWEDAPAATHHQVYTTHSAVESLLQPCSNKQQAHGPSYYYYCCYTSITHASVISHDLAFSSLSLPPSWTSPY